MSEELERLSLSEEEKQQLLVTEHPKKGLNSQIVWNEDASKASKKRKHNLISQECPAQRFTPQSKKMKVSTEVEFWKFNDESLTLRHNLKPLQSLPKLNHSIIVQKDHPMHDEVLLLSEKLEKSLFQELDLLEQEVSRSSSTPEVFDLNCNGDEENKESEFELYERKVRQYDQINMERREVAKRWSPEFSEEE